MLRRTVALSSLWIAVLFVFATGVVHAQSDGKRRSPDPDFGLQEARTLAVNGTELTYVDRGKGTPIVLVHGQASDFRVWQPLIEEASKQYRVIAYSRRYFFPNPSSRTLPQSVEAADTRDLIAFIEALGVKPVHLVGHSAGGHAALIVTIERPDLVRSLVLAEGGFLQAPGGATSNPGAAASRKARALLEAGQDEEAVRTFVDATSGAGAFDRMPEADRQRYLDNRMALGVPPLSTAVMRAGEGSGHTRDDRGRRFQPAVPACCDENPRRLFAVRAASHHSKRLARHVPGQPAGIQFRRPSIHRRKRPLAHLHRVGLGVSRGNLNA